MNPIDIIFLGSSGNHINGISDDGQAEDRKENIEIVPELFIVKMKRNIFLLALFLIIATVLSTPFAVIVAALRLIRHSGNMIKA